MTSAKRADLAAAFPILFGSRWPARGLDNAIASIDVDALRVEYRTLGENAPRRSLSGKSYFVGHTGFPAAADDSNRLEEHSAIALVNLQRSWPRSDGGWFRLLDYQVPLKARQSDVGIGKIDLLGVTDQGRLVVVELKVEGQSGGRSDSPPAALMEGLRYAAMVEADLEAIASEAEQRFDKTVARIPPIVQLLAPEGWWRRWTDLPPAGDWGRAFAYLATAIEEGTGISIECMAFDNVEPTYGSNNQAPRFERVPALRPVCLRENLFIGDALCRPPPGDAAKKRYMNTIHEALWSWADQHHEGQLDGGERQGRSPVLKRDAEALNVLVPPEGLHADEIRAAIARKQRHRHFASLRSSQALAQSVFGALTAFGRLDLLKGITANCGRPAFFTDQRGWSLELEHEVDTLGEPRPTSIDVLLRGPDQRTAIECKFTEGEFGTCSRPNLKPSAPTYQEQRCDGSYRAQAGRSDRCALTAIGVQYWKYLPLLFAWPADRDQDPCPFGAVYQLARNALAAAITPDGEVGADHGHALVIYDARNPAFQVSGAADRQWEAAIAACLVPGLMRRLSWQRLMASIAAVPDLAWLVDALEKKYGLVPK